jgi:hypothetical protein
MFFRYDVCDIDFYTEAAVGIAVKSARHVRLGGKNAMLVLDDADVEKAADGVVAACFLSAGQLCVSIERLYVAESIHHQFVAAFTARAERPLATASSTCSVTVFSWAGGEAAHVAAVVAGAAHLESGQCRRADGWHGDSGLGRRHGAEGILKCTEAPDRRPPARSGLHPAGGHPARDVQRHARGDVGEDGRLVEQGSHVRPGPAAGEDGRPSTKPSAPSSRSTPSAMTTERSHGPTPRRTVSTPTSGPATGSGAWPSPLACTVKANVNEAFAAA